MRRLWHEATNTAMGDPPSMKTGMLQFAQSEQLEGWRTRRAYKKTPSIAGRRF
jgi:hypothetical protein